MVTWLFYGIAVLCLILIPFTPSLVRIRIRILRWLGWQWAVGSQLARKSLPGLGRVLPDIIVCDRDSTNLFRFDSIDATVAI